jgi:hypothetical protein
MNGLTSPIRRRTEAPAAEPAVSPAVTPRAVLLGLASAVVTAATAPYLSFRMGVWLPGSDSLMTTPLLVLLAMVFVNGLILRWWPGRAFTRKEMLAVYVMLIVSLGWLTKGGLPFLAGLIPYPFYRATPANGWDSLIIPYIPSWLRLTSPEAVTGFWEGIPEHTAVPWAAWRQPIIVWSAFTCALMVAALCAASLLRKDWIERQRLTFPLADIPLAITGERERPSAGTTSMRQRAFLLGFAVPAFLGVLGWLHRYIPSLPTMNLYQIPVGRAFSGMGLPWSSLSTVVVTISWAVLGVMCLIPSEVSLSLGLFYVLNRLQLFAWAAVGLGQGQTASAIDPGTFTSFEQGGGIIALAGLVLYESRHSLRLAWESLRRRRSEETELVAPMPSRLAIVGFFAANAFMLWCCSRMGMSWWSFVMLMTLFYLSMLVGSKLVAAGGVLTYHPGLYSFEQQLMAGLVGPRLIGPSSFVTMTCLTQTYMDDPGNLVMPQMMNALKLGHAGRLPGRRLSWAMLAAIVAVIVVGWFGMLAMIYHYGATTLQPWPFTAGGDEAFGFIDPALRDPGAVLGWKWSALGIGGAVMMVLWWLQLHVAWWPLSPLGFVIASGWSTENELWTCALIGWLLTTLIKRYGGLRLYRMLRPAFLGLVIGDLLTSSATGILNVLVDWRRLMGQ